VSRIAQALLACVLLTALTGCGTGSGPGTASQRAASAAPAYVTEPFTQQQQLVEQGARLVVADGCSACHLLASKGSIAPSFSSFAGHHVTLTDGHAVLVDEHFLREALLHPRSAEIKGYEPGPMLAALRRLRLAGKPRQVAALAAFIEQIGPEPGP
jgi:hypothetical protein